MRYTLFITMIFASLTQLSSAEGPFQLTLRSRSSVDGKEQVVEKTAQWDPKHTAIIICDMWDDHWCRGAAARVVEMAGPMNQFVDHLRQQGALIIHAPSTCVEPYRETPARRRALEAPTVQTLKPLATSTRWGTCWSWLDPTHETELPIDDSDMGCDCEQRCTIREAWTRQIDAITIDDRDAVTDNGQELFNLLAQRKIEHVAIMGVHLNMCVLGRPFGIRELVNQKVDVCLIRDMTDTMYNHRMRPLVDHFQGTDLMIEHVERYWCPTFTSNQIMGGEPFAFKR